MAVMAYQRLLDAEVLQVAIMKTTHVCRTHTAATTQKSNIHNNWRHCCRGSLGIDKI